MGRELRGDEKGRGGEREKRWREQNRSKRKKRDQRWRKWVGVERKGGKVEKEGKREK